MKYLFTLLILTSCSASYHYTKAVKKGMRIDTSKDTIQVPYIDSIPYPVPGTDSIIYVPKIEYRDTIIDMTNFSFPKTRKEVKLEKIEIKQNAKTERKLISVTGDIKQDSIKQVAKTERIKVKHETKSKKQWSKFWLGFCFGIILSIIFTFILKIKMK